MPDSGTAGNALISIALGGSGYGLLQGDTDILKATAAPIVVWGLYTKTGRQWVANYLRSGKPRAKLREALENLAPTSGLLSSQQLTQELN